LGTLKIRKDLVKLEIPEVWVEIGEAKKRKMLIGVVYHEFRQWGEGPQRNSVGEERLLNWFNRQEKQLGDKSEKIIMGDWNADMLRLSQLG
jgi:hypothetical protein